MMPPVTRTGYICSATPCAFDATRRSCGSPEAWPNLPLRALDPYGPIYSEGETFHTPHTTSRTVTARTSRETP
ncbi:hypothetical protein E2C01_026319 [Portunus trituberculatus]|uniref:Uncharacterized protein n=1 Tax=Portunus trituberculatus TaxID=210409 RepID=A0A5B7EFC8_PORTR|nr:hypothetical protein [Portunus trituberculatus]